ncbi:hypothetical protein [Arthrobacter mobilis]|uniref:Uncharacterized protein n=1 Tax=Arthrobacter mobilis TaxID=2724944 RepID=A0A7X6HB62_9MICC|nr:hypothetical protein [Arthrobacter mobilis]NKX53746.1 hypothetical protein [Arthrobacter mobilis]
MAVVPARRRRGVIALPLCLVLAAGGTYAATQYLEQSQTLVRERCTASAGAENYDLAPDQAANAALITGIAVQRGLPARAASIALATAIQESKLRNLDHGDKAGPDSRGLFQQRPSQGWGTEAEVMDPVYAANRFYAELEKVDGYEEMAVTEAAQRVQRSAYPDAYADHEAEGKAFASALTGHSPAALDCVLKRASAAGDPAAVQAHLAASHPGLEAEAGGRTLAVAAGGTTGWAVAQWAVATADELHIDAVSYAGMGWNRSGGWEPADVENGSVVITLAGQPAAGS